MELGKDPVETLSQLAIIAMIRRRGDVTLNFLDFVERPVKAKRAVVLNDATADKIRIEECVLLDVGNLLGTQKHGEFGSLGDSLARNSHGTGDGRGKIRSPPYVGRATHW